MEIMVCTLSDASTGWIFARVNVCRFGAVLMFGSAWTRNRRMKMPT